MKIRFFGSSDCKDCLELFVILNKSQVEYEYIDTSDLSDEIQSFCDRHNIDELPHVQFLDDKDKIQIEHIGPLNEESFLKYLVDFFPDY